MASGIFRVPLVPTAQRFDITFAGRALTLTARWNGEAPAWSIDLADGLTGESLLNNLDLVTGVDLLEQFRYLGIAGGLFAFTDGDSKEPPTETNLGTGSNLYLVTV